MSGLTMFSEKKQKHRRTAGVHIPSSQILSASVHREEADMTYFQLETAQAKLVFKADDLRSRNQWIRGESLVCQ